MTRRPVISPGLARRFWAMVSVSDGCWEWTGAVHGSGYGVLGAGRRGEGIFRAHRLSWEMVNGAVPDGHFICHHCDNRRCVRPDHLFAGTPKDNAQDMWRKGRGSAPPRNDPARSFLALNPPKGERNSAAKLTAESVAEIRAHFTSTRGDGARLARQFGVSKTTISKIARRLTWV